MPRKPRTPKAVEPPLPPIPPEVQAKIDAARKAVAEAIVAAQDAGLIETSIDPPPILDILITGRVTDARTLKGAKPYGMSPEVFGAWFTATERWKASTTKMMCGSCTQAPGSSSSTSSAPESWSNTSRKPARPRDLRPTPKKEATKPAEPPSRRNRQGAGSQNHRAGQAGRAQKAVIAPGHRVGGPRRPWSLACENSIESAPP